MKRLPLPKGGDGGRMAVVAYLLCAVYLHIVISLVSWTVLPAVVGFDPTLIISGSMSPRINTGDVVLLGEPPAEGLRSGNVVTYADSNRPGRLVTHRVVRRNADGTYTTRGDANGAADSHEVEPGLVRGIGRAVIPAVGAPAMWVREGDWAMLLGWVTLSVMAFAYLGAYGRARPARWGWSAALDATPKRPPHRHPAPSVKSSDGWEPPLRPVRRIRWAVPTLGVIVAIVAASLPAALASEGAWGGAAANPGNDFLASDSFCEAPGPQTLTPTADAKTNENTPTTNYGATADLVVDPRTNRINRSFLTFALPVKPAHCLMTATLRLYVTAGVAGRTLEALRSAAAWTEAGLTWNTAPTMAGTPVTQPSRGTAGWLEFTVTDHVAALYAGANNGFVVKDVTEAGGAGNAQTFSSRTGANPPQLVLNFDPIPVIPDAPTSLSATAQSDAAVDLAWTDNGTNETEQQVQVSPAGAGTWGPLVTLAPDVTTYTHSGLTPGSAYDYRIRAANIGGASPWSNVASATTNLFPPAPTGLNLVSAGVNNLQVAWTDTSANEIGFQIESSPTAVTNWTVAGTVGPNITAFNVTGLTANTGYKVRVRAQNAGGDSTWSNELSTTTAACASAPTLTMTAIADAALVESTPTTAVGSTSPATFLTRARNNDNARSLVQFGAPTIPLGCNVATATLRLNVTSQTSARTVNVVRANAAWGETTVTWNTQPTTTGTPVSATSAVGWTQWTVTNEVLAMIAGMNNGFLVSDATEGGGIAQNVNMSSREGANPPELVVTFGP